MTLSQGKRKAGIKLNGETTVYYKNKQTKPVEDSAYGINAKKTETVATEKPEKTTIPVSIQGGATEQADQFYIFEGY